MYKLVRGSGVDYNNPRGNFSYIINYFYPTNYKMDHLKILLTKIYRNININNEHSARFYKTYDGVFDHLNGEMIEIYNTYLTCQKIGYIPYCNKKYKTNNMVIIHNPNQYNYKNYMLFKEFLKFDDVFNVIIKHVIDSFDFEFMSDLQPCPDIDKPDSLCYFEKNNT